MVANKLAANEIKTAALFIRPTNQTCYSPIKLKLGTKLITKTKVENLLGISISSDLKWHVQIRSLSQSLYHRLFIIQRLKQILTRKQLIRTATALFISKLRYCMEIYWPVRISENDPLPLDIQPINTIYNKLLRVITNKRLGDKISIRSMLNSIGWPSINQLCVKTRL